MNIYCFTKWLFSAKIKIKIPDLQNIRQSLSKRELQTITFYHVDKKEEGIYHRNEKCLDYSAPEKVCLSSYFLNIQELIRARGFLTDPKQHTGSLLLNASWHHSCTLAWKIPWMEEPGRLQSMGSLRVRHDWATVLWLFTFMHWRRKWQPTPVFLPGESQGWGSLVGCCLWGHTESDMTEAT